MKRLIESKVPPNFNEERIDKYLATRFTYQSRSKWQSEIECGNIIINGHRCTSFHKKIKTEDVIIFKTSGDNEPDVDFSYSIIFEDEDIIGINKTGDLPVHPAGIYFEHTLLMDLQNKRNKNLFPVHRLDRETSGVILMAKNKDSASKLQSGFNSFKKEYIAIVQGTSPQKGFTVDVPIGNDEGSEVRKKRRAYPDAKESAKTDFKPILAIDKYSLVKAYPQTGRLHQIRVHLQYAGFPIVGDKIYGGDESLYLEFIENGYTDELTQKLELPRTGLHARKLTFYHPVHGEKVVLKAPIPADMTDFIWSKL